MSVNISKMAPLFQKRTDRRRDIASLARDVEGMGAEGITVTMGASNAIVTADDVYMVKNVVTTELNIEGVPSPDFVELIKRVKPTQVTLVNGAQPGADKAWWNVQADESAIKELVETFQTAGVRVALYVDCDVEAVEAAARIGADRVSLYTSAYSHGYVTDPEEAVKPFVAAAEAARNAGVGVNAGHGLGLENLAYFSRHVGGLQEVAIGQALICDALYDGLEQTIKKYKESLK